MENENQKQVILPEDGNLVVSSSPHIHENITTRRIMFQVILCMLPIIIAATWFFGLRALVVILACTAFSVLFEYLWNKLMKQPVAVGDLSAAVTGVILGLNMPPAVPLWVCAVGAFFAIIVAKQLYGGLGQNPFNPAAVARVALLIGFAGPMTRWENPQPGRIFFWADAVSGATPLMNAKAVTGNIDAMNAITESSPYWDYFFGYMGGSIGEISALAVLIGVAGLFVFRLVRWEVPVSILGTIALFTWIVHSISPATTPGPLFHLLTGAVLIGAFFMATDMVTSPLTFRGGIIFGIGIGIITCVIRIWGAYPEGMSFAIVIMNALVPLIDRVIYHRPFGWIPHFGGVK